MNRRRRTRISLRSAGRLLLLVALAAGCTPPAAGLRRTHELVKAAPVTPADFLERGWTSFVMINDLRGALSDFNRVARLGASGRLLARARLGAGLDLLLQADFAAAGEAMLSAVEAAPDSAAGLAAAVQLREIAHQLPGGHRRIATRLQKLVSSGRAGAECARELRLILLEGARRRGELAAVADIEARMGVVPIWRVAFPFGRDPLLDFEHTFAPESGPLAAGPITRLAVRPADQGLLTIDSYGRQGVAYAESFFSQRGLNSGKGTLDLRIRSDEPWAAWLDGRRLAVHDSERRRLPKLVRLRLEAGPGWHRLLVKVPIAASGAGLSVEITGAGGKPAKLDWWTRAAALAGRTPKLGPGGPARPAPQTSLGERLADKLGEGAAGPAARVTAALLIWESGDPGRAGELLEQALGRAPDSALLNFLLGLIALEDEDLPPPIDRSRSRERLGRAVAACPTANLARFRLMLLPGAGQGDYMALSELDDLEAKKPGLFLWPYFRGSIFAKLGWEQAAYRAYHRALGLLPDDPELLKTMFQRARHAGSAEKSLKLARRLEALGLFDDLADFWEARENPDRAQKILKAASSANPARLENLLELVDFLAGRGRSREALKLIDKGLLLSGCDPRLLDRRANLLDALGQADAARSARMLWIACTPWDTRARRAAAAAGASRVRLAGEERIEAAKIIKEFERSKTVWTGDAVLVLDQTAIEVGRDGSNVARMHTIAKVLTPAGLERFGEIDPPANGADLEILRTIKPDGRVLDAEAIPGKDSVSLKQLKVGDYVEIEALSGSPPAGPAGDAAGWLGKRWYFRAPNTSVYRSLYSVAVPRGTHLAIDTHGQTPSPRMTERGEFEIALFKAGNLSPITPEPDSVPLDEFVPFVQLGYGIDWSDLRDALRAALVRACRPAPELSRFLETKAANGDLKAKLIKVFHWVALNIRQVGAWYDFSEPASHILLRREGNRLVLLAALVHELGPEPRVYLARTSTDSHASYRFPNPGTYRHGLVTVSIDGKTYWMDPTARFNAFDTLYPFLNGEQAIDVSAASGSPAFARLSSDRDRPLVRTIQLTMTLSENGDLAGQGVESIPTSQAPVFRELLSSFSPNRRRQALEAGLGNYFSGAVLEGYQVRNLDDPDQPLVIEYDLRVPGFARLVAHKLILHEGFYPYRLGQGLAHGQSRSLPLLIGAEARTTTAVTIKLPPGARPEVPKPVSLAGPLGKFSYRAAGGSGRLKIEKSLLVPAGRVAPKDYPAFLDFCRRVDANDEREIVIKLSGTK